MRRYTISVNGTEHVVDVEEVTANTFRVELDGIATDVRLTDHQALSQAMITPNVEVGASRPVGGAAVDAPAIPAGLVKPAPRPAASAPAPSAPAPAPAAPAAGGAGALTAPMPGVVLTVNVAPGNAVKRGDTLVVLEAMKMKNELKSRTDGVVASVPAVAGNQVAFGDVLVTFEG